ncbi:MAG TPA: hypothetical protein PLV33_13575 [Opitutaceae bacterium]|nr:hypothetical protein [Opitutaceae bacterium]HOR26154.1 hypothetical protein [Opitutaceae bacterium]HPK50504.1 hypothetical protein [Opitutaceae bacterium]
MSNYSKLTSLAVLALGVAFFAASAQADNSTSGEKSPQPGKRVLKKYDLNKNGQLDPDEQAAWEADKAAKKAERAKHPKAPKPKIGDPCPPDCPLAKYDANKNGVLDADEHAAWKAEHKKHKKKKECSEKPCEPAAPPAPAAPEPPPPPVAK